MFEFHFDWDPVKAQSNRRKHGIAFELAATAFEDPLALSVPDDEHSDIEKHWLTLGRMTNGLLAVIVHTYHELGVDAADIRIISARPAGGRERRQYKASR